MEYNFSILIPAYQPDQRLVELVDALQAHGFPHIVVVDDGGGEAYAPIFRALDGKATVLTHQVNRGKGAALRTGISHILATDAPGVITADADGQHTPEDITKLAKAMVDHPESLVLGVRDKSQMPGRSKFGNNLTCGIFAAVTGTWISDTQTGLRGIPASMLPMMLELEGDRYEYETNMLLEVCARKLPIEEVVIETIYIDDNASSHFRPVQDGLRIYALIFRRFGKFIGSSGLSFLVDYGLFMSLRAWLSFSLLAAVVTARVCSSLVNYTVNRTLVFGQGSKRSFFGYYALVLVIMLLSYLSIGLLTALGLPELLSKIISDVCLFLLSYKVQKNYIFR